MFTLQATTRAGSAKKVMGGSGAGVRKMFATWYNRQNCYTLTRPRNAGYTHKDVIKLMHLKVESRDSGEWVISLNNPGNFMIIGRVVKANVVIQMMSCTYAAELFQQCS